ncbi:MAG TPA: glycosyltransferase family 2 protein [Pyrinomonadaceae bacterium]|nr:glycosyltransferase family 2 protein [Pyrinomonadaceae bacterium]
MKISVVIPTHNRVDALQRTLSHLAKQSFDHPWEVIVVNNRSTDDTDAVVRNQTYPVPLELVHCDIPGAAATRNKGAAHARGEFLVFIDNDILVEPDFLKHHWDTLQAHPGAWVVGQISTLPEYDTTPFGRFRASLFPLLSATGPHSETDAITTANLSLPKKDFEALGGFDESFFVASGEDRELLMRAQQRGVRLVLDPGIVVLHNDWAGSTLRDFCRRNRLYTQTEPLFWRKYGDEYPRQELVKKNSPPNARTDPFSLRLKKRLKQMIGRPAGQTVLIGLSEVCERVLPWPPVLWRLYRWAVAGAIYRGFQEGLAILGSSEQSRESGSATHHG